MRLIRKTRIGAKYKREYDKPTTPYERVLADPSVPTHVKHRLTKEFRCLNPLELQKDLQRQMKAFFRLLEKEPIRRIS